ncbi:hypothetical protein H4R35_002726 [Dimargaris xerosporica]|nr:hypothetical protein H4R35_002726 [Dimargaris xerosporica]
MNAAINGAKPSTDMRKLNLNRIMTVFRHLARNNNAVAQNLNQSVVEFENNLFQRAQSAADYTRMAEQELQRVCARFGVASADTAPGEATAQPVAAPPAAAATRPHPIAAAAAPGPTGQAAGNPTGQAPAATQQQLTEAQLATLLAGISPQLVLPEDQLKTLSQLPFAQQQQYIRAQYMNVKNQQTALLQQQKQQPAPPQPTSALGSAPPTSQTTAPNPVANGATKDNQAALLQAQRADLNQLMVTLMRNPDALVSFVSQLPNPAPAGGVPLKFQQRTVTIPKLLIEKLQMEVQRRQKQQETASNQPTVVSNSAGAPPSNPAATAMGTQASQPAPAPAILQAVPQSQALATQPSNTAAKASKPLAQAPPAVSALPVSSQPPTASPAVVPTGQPMTGSAPPLAAATAVGGDNSFEQQMRLMVLKRVHGLDISEHLKQLDDKDKHLVQQLIIEYQDIVGALETVCAAFVARQRDMHPMFQSFLNMKALIFKQMDLFSRDQYIVIPEKLRDMCTKVEELVHKLWSLVPGNRPLPQRRSVAAQQAQTLPTATGTAPVAPVALSQPLVAPAPAASLPVAPVKAEKHALSTSEIKQPSRKKAAVNKGSTGSATPTMTAAKTSKTESATPTAKKGKDASTESPTASKGAKASTARGRTTKTSRPKKESTRAKATGTKKGTKATSKPSTPVIAAKEAGGAVGIGSAIAPSTTLPTASNVLTTPSATSGSLPAVAAAGASAPGSSKPSASPAQAPIVAPSGTPQVKPTPVRSSPAVTTPKALDPDVKWTKPVDYFTEMLRGLCSSGPSSTTGPPPPTNATVPGLSLAALFGPPLAQQSQWFD